MSAAPKRPPKSKVKPKPAKKPVGRPSLYSDKLATKILDLISDGASLRSICKMKGMPSRMTIITWLSDPERAEFLTKYARAREWQGDVADDRIQEIVDGVLKGKIDPHAARVAIGGLTWRASKLKPKVYGDRQQLEHSGPNGAPIQHVISKIIIEPVDAPKPQRDDT